MSIATFLQGSKRSLMDRLRGVDSEEEQTPGSDAHANGTPAAESDRPSLTQNLSQSPLPQTSPSLRDELTSKPSIQLGAKPPKRPSLADELKAKQDAVGQQPTTTRGKIGKAIMTALPTALGGLFGGTEGASGAAEGTMEYQDTKRQQENLQRKSIGEELEAERQRQAQFQRDQANRQFESGKLGEELRARAEEAAANRGFQTSERLGEQDFRSGEAAANRGFQTSERIGGETFRAGEGRLERDMRISQEEAGRKFQGTEGAADRASRERMNNADISSRERLAGEKNGGGAAQDNVKQTIDDALNTIGVLESGKGFNGAVGWKGPIGTLTGPIAGTNEADYASHFDALKAQLVLPKLQMLRGLGAMSDREFATLSSAATALNRNMSEEAFLSELSKIKTGLQAAQQRLASRNQLQPGTAVPMTIEYDFVPGKGLVPKGTPR